MEELPIIVPIVLPEEVVRTRVIRMVLVAANLLQGMEEECVNGEPNFGLRTEKLIPGCWLIIILIPLVILFVVEFHHHLRHLLIHTVLIIIAVIKR